MDKWLSYSAGVCFSAVLHGVLLLVLIVGWQGEPELRKIVRPQYIEATLLEIKPKARPVSQTKAPIKPAQDRAEKQRKEQELKQQRIQKQARLEKKSRATAAKVKAAKDKAVKDKAAKDKAAKDKAAKDKAAKEKLAQQNKLREDQLLAAMDEEQAFLDSEEDAQLIGSYSSYINDRVSNNWSRPSSARRGMIVELAIQLVPTGRVVSVTIVKSSGNEAFDRSAERAVRKVDRFEKIAELAKQDLALFDREFRRFLLVFNPKDLRQ